VQGFYDHESRDSQLTFANSFVSGLNGRTTNTGGAIGGIDYTSQRLLSVNDALALGVLTGYTDANIKGADGFGTHVTGTSVGVYGVYVNGGFSVDSNSKVDFLSVDQDPVPGSAPISTNLRNYVTAANVNYKIFAPAAVGGWVEPTVGMIYTQTSWDNAFSQYDGHVLRVQGGARFGQSINSGGIVIEPTLTALLYNDVVIDGLTLGKFGPVPTDQGKLFEQVSFKLNFDFGKGLSSSIEAEVRHGDLGSGAEATGAAGRVGVRYYW
jgi:hypothetical protein